MKGHISGLKRRFSSADEWPGLKVTVLLLPWTWCLFPRLYHDDDGIWGWLAFGYVEWLMFKVEWFCNRPPFTELFLSHTDAFPVALAAEVKREDAS